MVVVAMQSPVRCPTQPHQKHTPSEVRGFLLGNEVTAPPMGGGRLADEEAEGVVDEVDINARVAINVSAVESKPERSWDTLFAAASRC